MYCPFLSFIKIEIYRIPILPLCSMHVSRSIPSLFLVSHRSAVSNPSQIFGLSWKRIFIEDRFAPILTTKPGDTSELLISRFLYSHRVAGGGGEDPRGYKISNFISPPPTDQAGRFSDSCQYRLLGWSFCEQSSYRPRDEIFSYPRGLLLLPPLIISTKITIRPRDVFLRGGNLIKNSRHVHRYYDILEGLDFDISLSRYEYFFLVKRVVGRTFDSLRDSRKGSDGFRSRYNTWGTRAPTRARVYCLSRLLAWRHISGYIRSKFAERRERASEKRPRWREKKRVTRTGPRSGQQHACHPHKTDRTLAWCASTGCTTKNISRISFALFEK